MTLPLSIASVTVATNAAAVLPRQLDALLRQTRPLQEIIVVDNGSTDSTLEMLRSRYPEIIVLELGQNLGVGGAFSEGLAYAALKKKHDWIWLLDEDSIPEDGALDQLLVGHALTQQLGKNAGVVACFPSNPGSGVSYPGLLWQDRLVQPSAESIRQRVWFVDATISSGTMIRRDVVEVAGLPRADFFMDLVDIEYSLRIRRHGYDIAMVRDSILNHTIGIPRVFHFLGFKKAWSDHHPWRQYYVMRNHTYVVWRFYPQSRAKLFMLERLLRHGIGILLFSRSRRQSFGMMMRGFLDGRSGKLGIRVSADNVHGARSEVNSPLCAIIPSSDQPKT
jgi:rhamnopyranosyl-N-acetylglucosaminyl-diphospho-decaprenol beta-1,3/1,4-galactofuranosyltransferase